MRVNEGKIADPESPNIYYCLVQAKLNKDKADSKNAKTTVSNETNTEKKNKPSHETHIEQKIEPKHENITTIKYTEKSL